MFMHMELKAFLLNEFARWSEADYREVYCVIRFPSRFRYIKLCTSNFSEIIIE